VLRLFSSTSFALGGHRRFIRRVAGICLVVMGMHVAADRLDDFIYPLVDRADLVVDEAAAALLAWAVDIGGFTPADALRRTEEFAALVDLPQKDRLAMSLALVVELGVDLLLIGLAWGTWREGQAQAGAWDELKASAAEVIDAWSPFDLERLAVLPVLSLLSIGGALLAARTVENAAMEVLTRAAPTWPWSPPLSAWIGILGAALLTWRFVPDLLHGALLRSHQRGEAARDRLRGVLDQGAPSRLRRATSLLSVGTRGAWLVVVALPLAIAGILAEDVGALLVRSAPSP
jgi:hypothetical protein